MNERKDAPAVAGQCASGGQPPVQGGQVVGNSIQQPVQASQGATAPKHAHKSGKSRGRRSILKLNSKTYSLAIKCYIEQLPYGLAYTVRQLQTLDKSKFQGMGIVHNRDTVENGAFWQISISKHHLHLILRATNRKDRFRVDAMLNWLGIYFRPGIDDELWSEHGVETVGNFSGYAVYLTHETEDAIRDGKEKYELSEIFSNLTPAEILQVRDGYTRVTVSSRKVSVDDMIELDKAAYELGYQLNDFNRWYNSQPFIIRSNAKMKTVRESYFRGVEARIEEGVPITRLCIYIQGEPNTGKTYAAEQALAGRSVHIIRGGGTGKYDNLRASHDAILIDDDISPNLLNMCDNRICHAYKRNKDNPVWSGHYFVVTSNLPFWQWLEQCGLKVVNPNPVAGGDRFTKHYYAARSRFYVCDLSADANGINHLACRSVSDRGTVEQQIERANMFWTFKQIFDSVIATYVPGMNAVDYSRIIERRE